MAGPGGRVLTRHHVVRAGSVQYAIFVRYGRPGLEVWARDHIIARGSKLIFHAWTTLAEGGGWREDENHHHLLEEGWELL